jgi:Ni,Fe-hydrogenase I cytochrome b subunit
MNRNSIKFFFLVPVLLLIIAPIFKFQYGFYVFLRLVIFITSGAIIYYSYQNTKEINLTVVIFCFIMMLFNPIIPVHLSREVWLPIDFIVAGVYGYSYLKIIKES